MKYVELHNRGVATGDFSPLLELFASTASLVLQGFPVGPFDGLDQITQAFVEHPPDDLLVLHEPYVTHCGQNVSARYAWQDNPARSEGTLELEAREGRITRLLIIHD